MSPLVTAGPGASVSHALLRAAHAAQPAGYWTFAASAGASDAAPGVRSGASYQWRISRIVRHAQVREVHRGIA
jgi:hypothetical protein